MAISGWYYLHTNGDLIYKRELGETAADIRESDFARALWPCDPGDRASAWGILVEALAAGAYQLRVKELAQKWGCDDTDADEYAKRIGVMFIKDGDQWCAVASSFRDLQESPAGFGPTKLEAMAELAAALGYRPAKMWGASFIDLVRNEIRKAGV